MNEIICVNVIHGLNLKVVPKNKVSFHINLQFITGFIILKGPLNKIFKDNCAGAKYTYISPWSSPRKVYSQVISLLRNDAHENTAMIKIAICAWILIAVALGICKLPILFIPKCAEKLRKKPER